MATKKVSAETAQSLLEAYALVIEEARQEFEVEKSEQSAAWKKELDRLKEEDNYQFAKEKRDREAALDAELKERVAAVATREQKVFERELAADHADDHLAELETKVADFPRQLSAAESTGFYKGMNEATKSAEADARIKEAEGNADKRVMLAKLSTQAEMLTNYENTMQSLHDELSQANARVQEIATNAVQASGQSKVTVNTATNK